MSLNAAALKLLAEKGLSAADIVALAEALESGGQRSSGAVRQARYRENKKARAVTNDVTSDVTRDASLSPPNDNILTPLIPPNEISSEISPPVDKPALVLEAYNLMAEEAGLSKAKMTPERRKKLKTFTTRHKVEDITEAIWAIPRTPFLCGENDRGWKANLDFLLQPKSFTKILEGSYGG